ncbi:phage tail tape measure protein [Paenibacillus sp. WQ 127069]|uniref:Phage tail tape measure protein n=1 Tax=Paenibacillus baimaensis TaxID=2982185 RepID=A0ABT2UHM3_9BACL|nr:phage tail tape measure protein [Paenibacillus sp. WQ 127069]MCU6794147.1 phage tail tape measure protein [Paenibacillus sp. WQ 127069]
MTQAVGAVTGAVTGATARFAGAVIDGSSAGLSRATTHSSSAASKSVGLFNDLQPLANVGGKLISTLTELLLNANDKYEQSYRILAAGSGKTGNELDELIQIHSSLMDELPNESKDIAKVMIDVMSYTHAEGKTMKELTKQLLLTSRLNNKDDLRVSSSLTSMMASNKIYKSEGIGVVDKVMAVSQNANLDVELVGDQMKQVGPKLQLLNMSFDESADLVGTWHNNGKNFETLESGISILLANMDNAHVTNYGVAFQDFIKKVKEAPTMEEASQLARKGLSTQIGNVHNITKDQVVTDWVLAIRDGLFDTKQKVDGKDVSKSAYLQSSRGLVGKNFKETMTFGDKSGIFGNEILNSVSPVANQLTGILSDVFSSEEFTKASLSKKLKIEADIKAQQERLSSIFSYNTDRWNRDQEIRGLPDQKDGTEEVTLFTNNTLNYMQAPMENPAYGPPGYPMPPAGYNNYPGAISNPANIEVNPVINVTVNGDSYESTAKDIAERIKEVIQEVFESASRRQGIAGV